MKTVKELREELDLYPDNWLLYGEDGEIVFLSADEMKAGRPLNWREEWVDDDTPK